MFTQISSEAEDRIITGEFLDWKVPACDLMSETQFMTAQEACSQAWTALQDYMRVSPMSLFTTLHSGKAPALLSQAIIDTCALQPREFDKRLSVDQLCDAALTRMGFTTARDEFGIVITGDKTAFPGKET